MNIDWTRDLDSLSNQQDRDHFFMDHGFSHESIYDALLQSGLIITHYPLTDMGDDKDWLNSHSQEHISIADAMGVSVGFDLSAVDFENKDDTAMWMAAHSDLHTFINQTLGL
jgi:transketolase N-terminal domain/subunit